MMSWIRFLFKKCSGCGGRFCPVYATYGDEQPGSPTVFTMHVW